MKLVQVFCLKYNTRELKNDFHWARNPNGRSLPAKDIRVHLLCWVVSEIPDISENSVTIFQVKWTVINYCYYRLLVTWETIFGNFLVRLLNAPRSWQVCYERIPS